MLKPWRGMRTVGGSCKGTTTLRHSAGATRASMPMDARAGRRASACLTDCSSTTVGRLGRFHLYCAAAKRSSDGPMPMLSIAEVAKPPPGMLVIGPSQAERSVLHSSSHSPVKCAHR